MAENEHPQVFDAFAPEYIPQLSNGTLEGIRAEVQQLATQFDDLSRNLDTRLQLVEEEMKETLREAQRIIGSVNGRASVIMTAIHENLKEQVPDLVKKELGEKQDAEGAV